MTPLEKLLAKAVTAMMADNAIQLNNTAAMLELLARRVPGITDPEQALFLKESARLITLATTRTTDAASLKDALQKLHEPDFPLS